MGRSLLMTVMLAFALLAALGAAGGLALVLIALEDGSIDDSGDVM